MKYDYGLKPLKFWCQKVLPLVYDESLSYEELLCKVVAYLNAVIEDVKELPDYIKELVSDERLKEILSELLDELREQIAEANEGKNETASKDRHTGELVWLDGKLVRMTRNILAGDRYVEEVDPNDDITGNFVYTTIEAELLRIIDAINDEVTALEDADTLLQGNISDEVTARENADIQLQDNINDEVTARENADLTLQDNIDGEVTARENADLALQESINEKIIVVKNMLSLGCVNDGVTDNSEIFNSIMENISDGDTIYFPKGVYYFSTPITITKKIKIMGCGSTNFTNGDLYSVLKFNTSGITLGHHSIELCDIGITTVNGGDYGVKVLYSYCKIHDIFIYDKDYDNYFGSCIQYGDSSTDTWYQLLSNIQINPYIQNQATATLQGNGVTVYSGVNCLFDNLFIRGKDAGIQFNNVENIHTNDGVNISNCIITWCNIGCNISGSAIKISNSFIDQLKEYTIVMDDCINCDIINTWLGGNDENVIIRNCEQIHFTNCVITGNPHNTWSINGTNTSKLYLEYCTLQNADYGLSFTNSDVKEIGTLKRDITNDGTGYKHLNESETFRYNINNMGTSNTYQLQLPVATYGTPNNVLISKGNAIWNVDYVWTVDSTNIVITFYKVNGTNFSSDNGLFVITLEK